MTTPFENNHDSNSTQREENEQNVEKTIIIESEIQPFTQTKNEHLPLYLSHRSQSPVLQWFYNLPIRRKQLVALFTSEFISVVGIAGVGALLIISGGRAQLLNQAKSEVAVTEINYNLKHHQMASSFQGHAENPTMIEAAEKRRSNRQVQTTLLNAIWKQNLEFATLVDTQNRIITTANLQRPGIQFNPNGLVTKALASGEQVQATERISYDELAAESYRFAQLRAQGIGVEPGTKLDFLIRYTVTPVKKPNSQVVGILVAGDIVKSQIVADTVAAFNGGYSAVYLYQPTGKFALATSQLTLNDAKPQLNVELPNTELLNQAVKAKGNPVTGSVKINSGTYTLAAKMLPDAEGNPVAILVRGTPETALNALLHKSLMLEGACVFLALLINVRLAAVMGGAIVNPLQRLQQATRKFAQGDRQARAEVYASDEVGQLATAFNHLADNIVETEQIQKTEAEREQQQNQAVQQELLKLLSDVEGAAEGDLTVRAEISAGQIGIVADFFNAILESLRDIVTEVKQAASQVNTSVGANEGDIRHLADEALKQATQITETLDAVEQMTQSIQEVSSNAASAAEIARTASVQAETGGAAMDRTVDSILQLRETVAETAKKLKRLGESSQQISQVISLINQIALKTNILAVNASIEAARAGEEGRGFAVVAEEVGQLAAQSAAATKQIEAIVATIQRETNEVVGAMEVGTSQVVEGTHLVEAAKQSLGQIVAVSHQIDQLLQSISSATVSQTEKSQMVTQWMQEIAKVSESTSDASSQVASSLQETVAIAQQLQASVGTFKIKD